MSYAISCSSQGTDELASDHTGCLETRENGPRSFGRDDESLSESERRRSDHDNVASGNKREVEKSKQRPNRGTLSNGERDTATIFLNEEQSQAVIHVINGHDEPVAYQQENDEQFSYPNIAVSQESQQTVSQPQPDEEQGLFQCHQMYDCALVNAVSSMGPTLQAIEHTCNREEFRLWKQKLDGYDAQKATRNKRNSGETFFIEILTQIAQLRQVDEDGVAPAIFSPAIYSDSFEYKVGIRLHPNGVDEEEGRYVALFVHMMMGEYDNASEVRWPFTQRITVSILDQSDAKRHISHIIQPKPHLAAFQKPTEAVSPTGYGFIRFAPIEEAFSFPYVENDKMFIKIQFSA